MLITILGATGFVGREIVQQALERKYQIKVLVRSQKKLGDLESKVKTTKGDYFNEDSLFQAIQGSDAVISTIGPPTTRNSDITLEDFRDAMQCLIKLMKKHNIFRFINLASTGTSYQGESLGNGRKLLRFALSFVAPLVIPFKEAELQALRESSINWTSICPPLIKSEVKGKLYVDLSKTQGYKVDVKQLAKFMLDNIEDKRWVKKAPFVGTK